MSAITGWSPEEAAPGVPVTFAVPQAGDAMQAPKLPAAFSLFRQRRLKGFDYTPRYYDAREEARKERLSRLKGSGTDGHPYSSEAMRTRLRHSWQREGGNQASSSRLLVLLGLFAALAYAAIRMLGLTDYL
jgi:hypothetical protein